MNYNLNPFLRQVAAHYLQEPSTEELCFILPNRRSILFLQHYFKELSDRPLLSPQMLTINDFLYKVAGAKPTDRVTLLLRLYDCYRQLNRQAEPLDEFIFWGDAILGDFSDVDKYLCEPASLFTNVAEFKELSDGFDYLNAEQKKAMERFVEGFRIKNEKSRGGTDDAREKFRQIWDLLFPLYQSFNRVLDKNGESYEGKVYRCARDRFKESSPVEVLKGIFPRQKKFVLTGLNMLTSCEREMLLMMRKHPSLAEFCWDYPGEWIADAFNKSSFMRKNLEDFPQAFALEKVGGKPHINVLPVASAVGQTRQIPSILRACGLLTDASSSHPSPRKDGTPASGERMFPLESLALILPDEGLLLPALGAIPSRMGEINVTMGYPMSQSNFYSFFQQVLALQLRARVGDGRTAFYHKPVWALFSSPVFQLFCDDTPEGKSLKDKVAAVKKAAQYYIAPEELSGHPLLDTLFQAVLPSPDDTTRNKDFARYLMQVVEFVGPAFSNHPEIAYEAAFAKAAHQAVSQLADKNPAVKPATFARLLGNLLSGQSIPFEGEPLKGLQVMGPLESRCLDFENLVVFSCNEGVFPRKSVSASFIPAELRLGFGLPTYEHQDAMWAYYFYRMIARSKEVWLLYDSRTEGLKKGEESRFVKQLRYHLGADITDWYESLPAPLALPREDEVQKTPEILSRIAQLELSPSSLESYIQCPMLFYFEKVEKLKPAEEVNEYLDGGMFGTVFHAAMEALYHGEEKMKTDESQVRRGDGPQKPGMKTLTKEYLKGWLQREKDIRWKVDSLIRHSLKTSRVSGRNLVMAKVIVRYVMNVIQSDLKYLEEKKEDSFQIVGLERNFRINYLGTTIKGVIDRLDCLKDKKIRVVDYKTGSDDPFCLTLKENPESKVFRKDVFYKHKAAIQFHLYDEAVRQDEGIKKEFGACEMVNVMYNPYLLSSRKAPKDSPILEGFEQEMKDALQARIDELKNPEIPFRKCAVGKQDEEGNGDGGNKDHSPCKYCDFKSICGR